MISEDAKKLASDKDIITICNLGCSPAEMKLLSHPEFMPADHYKFVDVDFTGKGLDSAYRLKFGVDPGPRPGLAWLADGIVIGSAQLQSLDRLAEHIIGIATAVEHARMSVNVGDGAPMIRDQIINQLIISGIETYQVDEYKTSIGSRSKAHIHAATRIALMGGIRVNNVRELKPTIGDLKEIQRQSRIHSSGDLTISTELARKVACGEITMDEAIRRA